MGMALTAGAALLSALALAAGAGGARDADLNELSAQQHAVRVNKCCEEDEVLLDARCRRAGALHLNVWSPNFTSAEGKENVHVPHFRLVIGEPDCESTQQRPVFDIPDSEDRLALLPDGRLRHYINHEHQEDSIPDEPIQIGPNTIYEPIAIPKEKNNQYYDYNQGKYCIDKIYITKTNKTNQYALVCVPEVVIDWASTDFLMKKVLNPIFHSIAMLLYLLVAIIYFVLPTLRDLAGNVITTINVCLIFSQAAALVRVFTELSSHVSFMVADVVLHISLLAAFFWLNSFGFYIWKTFKSRNVFLRVTDIRKYCYYSCFAWGCTVSTSALAFTAHFLLDIGKPGESLKKHASSSIISNGDQETIGWLGIAIFFTPVAFTVIVNIFFYVTTLHVIKRINTYGRIHYKLKRSFDLFLQLFLIMTFAWLFLLLSWLKMDGLIYIHIVVNLAQALLVFYVCVLRQEHVTFLLRKSCCYAEPLPTGDWGDGDEMTQMNGGNY